MQCVIDKAEICLAGVRWDKGHEKHGEGVIEVFLSGM
jgi:hypothetical protein